MESLAENDTEADAATTANDTGGVVVTQQPVIQKRKEDDCSRSPAEKKAAEANQSQQQQQPQPVGCAPFFGVKHYLNNFYGLPDDETSAKIWRQIENEDDYLAFLAASQSKNEVECWHVHRRCFAWSVSLGTLVVLLGMVCLLLGFLVPRRPVLVGQMDENDLKMWIATNVSKIGFNLNEAAVTSLNILDHKAIEHNNILDILKVGGLMATCLGVLLLVVALIFPPSRHPSTWDEEDNTPHISQINQALKNCLRSMHPKNNSNLFYSGSVALADEKIPVFQQLQSIQPQKN